jgi:hypothetical protein
MNCRIFFFTLMVVLVIFGLGCEATPDPVSSTDTEMALAKAEVYQERGIFLWDDLVPGECLEEQLQMNVSYDYLMHSTLDANGGYRVLMHMRPVDGVATGVESGGTWSSVGTNKWKDMWLRSGETHVISGTEHWHANQDGPDLIEHWQFTTRINADGEVKFDKAVIRITCK